MFYPLLLLILISLVICNVPKELVPSLYNLRVEEKEATPVVDSGTLVICMRGHASTGQRYTRYRHARPRASCIIPYLNL